jgi:hypothetical protein
MLVNGELPAMPWMTGKGERAEGCGPTVGEDALGTLFRDARSIAILRVEEVRPDCSGVGAYHSTLVVRDLLRGEDTHIVGMRHMATGPPFDEGNHFLAILEPLDPPKPRPVDPGRCLPKLPTVDAEIVWLFPTQSETQARLLLEHWSG